MNSSSFKKFYSGKRVLVTGHSGFKGSWLCRWLEHLGSEVYGISLSPNTKPSHFEALYKNGRENDYWADVRQKELVDDIFLKNNPEIVFHLAAQPSVLESYRNPLETIETNILGSANILNSACKNPSTKVVVIITTDKCYENKEWIFPYRENDELGGHDIYSSSKACVELITKAWQKSFLRKDNKKISIASARAGNVIGGGDWTEDRLVVDLVKSRYTGKKLHIRYPESTRPWQHVLDPLCGYLQLAMYLSKNKNLIGAYNFGPDNASNLTTIELINLFADLDKRYSEGLEVEKPRFHEASHLMVDSSKAKVNLEWSPVFKINEAVQLTKDWYSNYYNKNHILTDKQIELYMNRISHVY